MPVKNIMEDVVFSVIDRVIREDRSLALTDDFRHDIAAYVLNRISPRYVTSERGILHARLESKFFVQQKTDMLLLIHEAIEIITRRRMTPSVNLDDVIRERPVFTPHMIGEVLEETTFSIIPDVRITLLHGGKPAIMIDGSWANPYLTSRATMGYYHFWPQVELDGEGGEVSFEILFEHPKFHEKRIDFSVQVSGSFDPSVSKVIPIALLTLREGEDSSFLYE
jgi:competence protein ComFB